jgi:hypothetical protein
VVLACGAAGSACNAESSAGVAPAIAPADAAPSATTGDDAAADANAAPPASDDDDGNVFGPGDASAGSASCRPGLYSGTYQGTNDSSKVGGPTDFPIGGPMAITLVQSVSQHGELLTVSNDATFDATWGGLSTGDAASGLIVIHSTLAGQLDCGDGAFVAMSTDASWTLLTIPAGMATVAFAGTYDAPSTSIGGTFTITSAIATSTGTWKVTLEPGAGADP